ncbi:MAG: inositol monophosphatase [Sedimentisphaerales bacterium]|nr:inositol monophosphatase [Sedimentisphaerales bacterium]
MKLEHSDIWDMLETAVVAARLAGQRAMEEIKYVKSSLKNGEEMVSHADVICQRLIISRIKETYPDHGFLAEEGDQGALFKQPPRSQDDFWWVIDPIDGTNNYCHGLLSFAVSVALLYQGQPLMGVIFDPASESMYTAAKDMDAQLNNSSISTSSEKVTPFVSFGIDSHFPTEQTGAINNVMQTMRFRNLGTTALHMAYVAKGAMVGMVSYDTKLWDIAAGAMLVETAGGIVCDLSGKPIFPVDCASYQGQKYSILATNQKTKEDFLKLFGK